MHCSDFSITLSPLQNYGIMNLQDHGLSDILTNPGSLKGRGVWESNPPGTAPSDPPAVLKTVRPTGAPTPPCSSLQGVLCHSCLFLSSAIMPCRVTLLAQPTLKFPGMVECMPC